MSVPYMPAGYHAVTPYLIVDGAARAIAWYVEALGAVEVMRMEGGPDRIAHAEIRLGDSHVMLADEAPQHDARPPRHYGGSPVSLHLYVPDADAVVDRAVAAGATLLRPVQTMFYGDRTGSLRDPFGHVWHVATHVEEVPLEEVKRRMQEMAQG